MSSGGRQQPRAHEREGGRGGAKAGLGSQAGGDLHARVLGRLLGDGADLQVVECEERTRAIITSVNTMIATTNKIKTCTEEGHIRTSTRSCVGTLALCDKAAVMADGSKWKTHGITMEALHSTRAYSKAGMGKQGHAAAIKPYLLEVCARPHTGQLEQRSLTAHQEHACRERVVGRRCGWCADMPRKQCRAKHNVVNTCECVRAPHSFLTKFTPCRTLILAHRSRPSVAPPPPPSLPVATSNRSPHHSCGQGQACTDSLAATPTTYTCSHTRQLRRNLPVRQPCNNPHPHPCRVPPIPPPPPAPTGLCQALQRGRAVALPLAGRPVHDEVHLRG